MFCIFVVNVNLTTIDMLLVNVSQIMCTIFTIPKCFSHLWHCEKHFLGLLVHSESFFRLRATLESTELKVSTENMKMIKSIPSPRPHSRLRQSFANNKVKSSLEDSAVINGDRKSVDTTKSQSFLHHSNAFSNSHSNVLETKSDHFLGDILPGKPADTFSSNAIVSHVGSHVGNGELNGSIFQLDAAATKIQVY